MTRLVLIAVLGLAVADCSDNFTRKTQAALLNFQSNVAAVDRTIAEVSPTLAKYCDEAQSLGKALDAAAFVDRNSKAAAALRAVNSGIETWCQRPPTNIATAINSVVNIVKNAGMAAKQTGAI